MGWKSSRNLVPPTTNNFVWEKRFQHWDKTYGEGNWAMGYEVQGKFIPEEEIMPIICYNSYKAHFEKFPKQLETMLELAGDISYLGAHNNKYVVDYYAPAIKKYVEENGLAFKGEDGLFIGFSSKLQLPSISEALAPRNVNCSIMRGLTLSDFEQRFRYIGFDADQLR